MSKASQAAFAAAVGLLAALATMPPARADGDRGGWRGHDGGGHAEDWRRHDFRDRVSREQNDWREHTWRRWDHGPAFYAAPPAFYAQPPRYYAQPPTYYVPAPNYYGN